MSALISVIIPIFNAERYLALALESVLAQTHKNLEVICVNDGSFDNSLAILQCYAKKDSRVCVITTLNAGQSAASNVGLKEAKGDYIKFVDADDLIALDHLEIQYNAIKDLPDCLASCEWASFYGMDHTAAQFRPEEVWQDLLPTEWLLKALSQPQGDMMAGWVWLIPKTVMDRAGLWNEALSLNNDFEFSVRLLFASSAVKFAVGARLYHRGDNPGSVSAKMSEKAANSAYLTTKLGCDRLLANIPGDKIRLLCANRYQIWLHRMYPAYPAILQKLQLEVDRLGGSTRKLRGGRVLQCVAAIFGWRAAKRLRMFRSFYLRR